jgi:hypothetical protein
LHPLRLAQAVVSVNTLVRQKGTEAGLTEGVWSLVQQYEGQLVGMTQYVLQETLPGLTHYVETRASDFLVSHNLSRVRNSCWQHCCYSSSWVFPSYVIRNWDLNSHAKKTCINGRAHALLRYVRVCCSVVLCCTVSGLRAD